MHEINKKKINDGIITVTAEKLISNDALYVLSRIKAVIAFKKGVTS